MYISDLLFISLFRWYTIQDALRGYESDRVHRSSPATTSSPSAVTSTSSNGSLTTHLQDYLQFGEKFKAYPTCVNHCCIPQLIAIIKHKVAVFKDILNISGYGTGDGGTFDGMVDRCKYVVSVRVCMYPMSVCACWIIIGQIAPEEG